MIILYCAIIFIVVYFKREISYWFYFDFLIGQCISRYIYLIHKSFLKDKVGRDLLLFIDFIYCTVILL